MSNPMQKSMQGTSEFVEFQMSMQKSMMGSSQKIPISNASTVNRAQQQKDMKAYKQLTNTNHKLIEEEQGDDQNQFLNVGKWNKSKQSDVKKNSSQTSVIKQQTKVIVQQQKPKIAKAPEQQQQPVMVSKWSKKSSNESGTTVKVIQAAVPVSTKNQQQKYQKQVQNKPEAETVKQQQVIEDQSLHVDQSEEQDIEENQQEQQQEEQQQQQQQEEQQQQEQEQQEEEQQEQEQQQQEQDQQQEEQGDQNQEHIQQQQQPEQEPQPIVDKFTTGNNNNEFEQSSDAYKTEVMNTSGLNTQPKPSKWNKKAPLQTMTKYEGKKKTQSEQAKKGYLSRVTEPKTETAIQNNSEIQGNDEWSKVQKVLLRLKLLLA